MKGKIVWGLLVCLLVLSMALLSCSKETSTTTTPAVPPPSSSSLTTTSSSQPAPVQPSVTKTITATPTATAPPATVVKPTEQSNWWTSLGEPKYGGTLTFRATAMPAQFDPDFPLVMGGMMPYWNEHLFMHDWTVDRTQWDFKTGWTPSEFFVGQLLEKWEWQDQQTMIGHLRQGIHWQDKPPADGREMVASDIVFHYDRILGTGNGYVQPHPFLGGWLSALDHAEAQDKYTVVFKFKSPSIVMNMMTIVDIATINVIELPELCDRVPLTTHTGLITDWKNANGTGSFFLTDFVIDSSATLSRNPDYWGFDERYPKNRLPYTDSIRLLSIPDASTALAAIRTAKIDTMSGFDWHQADTLKASNPDLVQSATPGAAMVIQTRCDTRPFKDMNVRIALQLAIDNETLAKSYYGGRVESKPAGLIPYGYTGWVIPFDQWPRQQQEDYSFNPARAKQLLKDAGYPNGFLTNCAASTSNDMQLLQVIKSMFQDIGVNMEIRTYDQMTFINMLGKRNIDQMATGGWSAFPRPPTMSLSDVTARGGMNVTANNDPYFDAFLDKFAAAPDVDAAKKVVIEADQYLLAHHWAVITCPTVTYTVWQPYLKGYSGESMGWVLDWYFTRCWLEK